MIILIVLIAYMFTYNDLHTTVAVPEGLSPAQPVLFLTACAALQVGYHIHHVLERGLSGSLALINK